MKKVFDITVVNTFESQGEEKNEYTVVGVAFHNEKSNSFSCKIKNGLSVTGEFVLFERKPKTKK